jgi:hypothetical protein
MSRILITGGRAPVALELARQFAAGGDVVFAADSAPYFLARSSSAVTRAYDVPPARHDPRAFAQAIAHIVAREHISRIVPTCEEVFYLASSSACFPSATELFCPPLDVLRSLHDKWSFARLARGHGVQVPDTWRVESTADLAHLPLPPQALVFKPVFSRFAVHTLVTPSPAAVARLRPTPAAPWLAQRFVAGRELCTYAIARDGRLTAHAAYAPTWRAGHSSSFYFSPVDCPALEHFTASLVSQLHVTGQIGFDFIQSPDGSLSVLECNPRATSGVHLFGVADRLGSAFTPDAAGIRHPALRQPRMLASAMVVLGLGPALRSRRLGQWLADFRQARDVIWSARDPRPAVYLFVGLADYLNHARRHRISPVAASTRDLEWDGQAIA